MSVCICMCLHVSGGCVSFYGSTHVGLFSARALITAGPVSGDKVTISAASYHVS